MRDNIFDTEREADKLNMSDDERAPGFNPQGLSVGEIRRRCTGIRMTEGLSDGQMTCGTVNHGDILD